SSRNKPDQAKLGLEALLQPSRHGRAAAARSAQAALDGQDDRLQMMVGGARQTKTFQLFEQAVQTFRTDLGVVDGKVAGEYLGAEVFTFRILAVSHVVSDVIGDLVAIQHGLNHVSVLKVNRDLDKLHHDRLS